MKFKVGDKIKFLNDVGGGSITKIIDNRNVLILTDEGFELPSLHTNIMLESNPFEKSKTTKNDVQEEFEELVEIAESVTPENIISTDPLSDDINLLFVLVPETKTKITESNLESYLINESNYKILYHISYKDQEQYFTIKSGEIDAGSRLFITQFKRNEINKHPELLFQFIFHKKNNFSFRFPVYRELNLQPLSLLDAKNYSESIHFDAKVVEYKVLDENIQKGIHTFNNELIHKILSEKYPVQAVNKAKEPEKNKIREFDLHIHNLVENERGLTDKDKLDLQLVHFNRIMNECIKNKEKKIIFIHGKGNGRLRSEIRRIIDCDYDNTSYQDASFQEYGFGATLVLFK